MFSSALYAIYLAYINRELTLEEFEDRLVPLLPAVFESHDPYANDLAGIAELGLSEVDAGILDENQFKARLRRTLEHLTTIWYDFSEATQGITISWSSHVRTSLPDIIAVPVEVLPEA